MESDKRLDFVARTARDLVLDVRAKCYAKGKRGCLKYLTQVEVVGFSFGAHVGSRTCEFLHTWLNEKVNILVGNLKDLFAIEMCHSFILINY